MTEFYLDGPPVHRLRYLLDYCQAKRIAPKLLTRGLTRDEALIEPLATLPWADFQRVVVNCLQILPEPEFHDAAAQYWRRPENNHWLVLGRSMATPFDLLIDLIGDAGHLFQDMPIQVTTQHRSRCTLIVRVEADSEFVPNTAFSELLIAELTGFAQGVALSGFRIDSRLLAQGFELNCRVETPVRASLNRWLKRLWARPLTALRVALQHQRRAESLLRRRVAAAAQTQRTLGAALAQTQMSLEHLLSLVASVQFEIDADNQLHAKTPESIKSTLGVTYFDQLMARLTDTSQADCEIALQTVRAGAQDQTFVQLTPLDKSLGREKLLFLSRGSDTRVQAALIQASARAETSASRPSPELSEALQTLSKEAACITDARGIITWHNPTFLHLTGSLETNCLGAHLATFVPSTLSDNQLRTFYQDQQAAQPLNSVTAWFLSIEGEKTPIQVSAIQVAGEVSPKKVYLFEDQSAVQAHQRVIHETHQQLETLRTPALIGEMTRGIAHDLGNLLTLIQLASDQIIKTSARPLPAAYQQLQTAVNDAGALTKTLLQSDFSGDAHQEQSELITLIQELLPSIEVVLGPEMTFVLEVDTARTPLNVLINRTTLKNIVLNLVINARDAMPTEGQLTLRILPDRPWVNPATDAAEVGHLIELTDNGAGIPSALQAHLFTPGFTTKGHRGGHGIGLSSIRQMITQQGGNFQLGPGPAGGTRARLWLPKAEKIDFQTRLSTARGSLPVRQRTALVVDADAHIREFLTLTLTSLNFKVFSAADGQAGLDLYLKQSVYLDLILSELVLPVLSGHRFLQQLYQTNPRQAVLILSAFVETEPHQRFLSDKPWVTLTKPFSLAQVKVAIQQAIATSTRLTPEAERNPKAAGSAPTKTYPTVF